MLVLPMAHLAFILAVRLGAPFWVSYFLAWLWLIPAFFLHRYLVRLF